MKKYSLTLLSTILLTGWLSQYGSDISLSDQKKPENWTHTSADIETAKVADLKQWWTKLDDPVLNQLITQALSDSPDRLIAEARIAEARGARRSARSFLFPQISAAGSVGREDAATSSGLYPDNFYEAGFDASYEIDIFGRNRKNLSAADEQLLALEEQYHDITLSLIAEITRTYIDLRAAQNQLKIAQKNLETQERTLSLINNLYELGESPKLDVERARNLVETTKALLPEFSRQAESARFRLSTLIGDISENMQPALSSPENIPGANIQPVLIGPARVLALRPDVRASAHLLAASSDLADATLADIFPTFTISGFYGVIDNALSSSTSIWNVALGAAVSVLDFGRIEGQIDVANAREKQAYEQYRKTVLEAVSEVETALSDYAHINQQRISLLHAYESANKSFELSQTLFKEGEIAFLDVLDAQRTVNDSQSALISAKAAQAESLTRLYKSLGVY